MLHRRFRRIGSFVRKRLLGGSGVESPALQNVGGAWLVVDSGVPDGHFVTQDGKLLIDETSNSGLTFSKNGPLIVNT